MRAAEVFQSIGTGATEPFRPQIRSRMLVYPIDYTMLSGKQFAALAAGCRRIGEGKAYLALYGTAEAGWAGTYQHRLVDLADYADYRSPGNLILEHLLFSTLGTWGVVTSESGEALVGGPELIHDLRAHLGSPEEAMIDSFVRDQRAVGRSGGSVAWVEPLLSHLYGAAAHGMWHDRDGDGAS